MIDFCAGTLLATAFLTPGVMKAAAEEAYPSTDAKYLSYPTYGGDDLGLTLSSDGSASLRLWAPTAEKVLLRIYSHGHGGAPEREIPMQRSEGGTWTGRLSPAPMGKYYTFSVFTDGKWLDETPGIWAKAVGVNGKRGAFVDLATTNPEGWDNDRGPALSSINAIDWNLKHLNADQFNYYRELIALRKAHPAFRMTSADDIARHLRFHRTEGPNLISYSLLDHANGDQWKEIRIVFNGSDDDTEVRIPKGKWLVVARDGEIDHTGLKDAAGNPITIPGGLTTVPHRAALILAR